MIKKIHIKDLDVGMYVHDLDCKWMEHPFMVSRFEVKNEDVIRKIVDAGIKHVYIDTGRGKDVEDAPTVGQVNENLNKSLEQEVGAENTARAPVETSVEIGRARNIYREANSIIKNLMRDIRLGKQVEVEAIEPIAENIMDSIFRNPHALTSVTRIKTRDEYTFMHSVSVAGLMVSFARAMDMPQDDIIEITKGALLHDIGKIMVPEEVLNKPDKLNDEEYEIMKSHVVHSREILMEMPGVTCTCMDAVCMHHERIDGTGYPLGLKGDQINTVGQMSAVVDVYDALTSVRVYKDAWEPTLTLKKMLEWSPDHFTTDLIQQFIRCLGIYPVGSLVELESGRVGLVMEQGDNLLRPRLRIIYNARKRHFVPATELDLEKETNDRIVHAISPDKYSIDATYFM